MPKIITRRERQHLVVLVIRKNTFIPKVEKLNINHLPQGLANMFTDKLMWELEQPGKKPIEIQFGESVLEYDPDILHPIIGIYDTSNEEHLNALCMDYASLLNS